MPPASMAMEGPLSREYEGGFDVIWSGCEFYPRITEGFAHRDWFLGPLALCWSSRPRRIPIIGIWTERTCFSDHMKLHFVRDRCLAHHVGDCPQSPTLALALDMYTDPAFCDLDHYICQIQLSTGLKISIWTLQLTIFAFRLWPFFPITSYL